MSYVLCLPLTNGSGRPKNMRIRIPNKRARVTCGWKGTRASGLMGLVLCSSSLFSVLHNKHIQWCAISMGGAEQRPNPKSLTGGYSRLRHRVAHGKCVGVDFGENLRWGYIVSFGIASHTPCFSLDSASVYRRKIFSFKTASNLWLSKKEPGPVGYLPKQNSYPNLGSIESTHIFESSKQKNC